MSRTKQTKRKIPGGTNKNRKVAAAAATAAATDSQAVVVYVAPELKTTMQLAEKEYMDARKACRDAQDACNKAKIAYKKAKREMSATVTYLTTNANTNDSLKAIVRAQRIAKKKSLASAAAGTGTGAVEEDTLPPRLLLLM